jgi:hypothetical protein
LFIVVRVTIHHHDDVDDIDDRAGDRGNGRQFPTGAGRAVCHRFQIAGEVLYDLRGSGTGVLMYR